MLKSTGIMRRQLKATTIESNTYLYPVPVIKEHKYLIKAESGIAPFLIYCFELGLLSSPDEEPPFLSPLGKHTDGKTVIYQVDSDLLNFTFLPHREKDLAKAETLEKLISNKIAHILKGRPNAVQELRKRFEKQKECSTCISLGILEASVEQFIDKACHIGEL